jgi:hypothetical protein
VNLWLLIDEVRHCKTNIVSYSEERPTQTTSRRAKKPIKMHFRSIFRLTFPKGAAIANANDLQAETKT